MNGDGYADVIVGASPTSRQARRRLPLLGLRPPGRRRGLRVPGRRGWHRERQPRHRRQRAPVESGRRLLRLQRGGRRRRERRRLRRRDRGQSLLRRRRPNVRGTALVFLGSRVGHRRRRSQHGRRPARVGRGSVPACGRTSVQRGRSRRRERRRLRRRDRRRPRTTTPASTNEGAAFVFLGSASGIADGGPGTAATRLESGDEGGELGVSVAGAGDVNGDGYDDVIVGTQSYAQVGGDAAYLFVGGASGVASGGPETAAARLDLHFTTSSWAALRLRHGHRLERGGSRGRRRRRLRRPDRRRSQLPDRQRRLRPRPRVPRVQRTPTPTASSISPTSARASPTRSRSIATGMAAGTPATRTSIRTASPACATSEPSGSCFGKTVWSGSAPDDPNCVESDMDGDGVVGAADFGLFRSEFGTPPGPSGYTAPYSASPASARSARAASRRRAKFTQAGWMSCSARTPIDSSWSARIAPTAARAPASVV